MTNISLECLKKNGIYVFCYARYNLFMRKYKK